MIYIYRLKYLLFIFSVLDQVWSVFSDDWLPPELPTHLEVAHPHHHQRDDVGEDEEDHVVAETHKQHCKPYDLTMHTRSLSENTPEDHLARSLCTHRSGLQGWGEEIISIKEQFASLDKICQIGRALSTLNNTNHF